MLLLTQRVGGGNGSTTGRGCGSSLSCPTAMVPQSDDHILIWPDQASVGRWCPDGWPVRRPEHGYSLLRYWDRQEQGPALAGPIWVISGPDYYCADDPLPVVVEPDC